MEFTDPLMQKMASTLATPEVKELEANISEARDDILSIAYASLCTAALTMRYCDIPFSMLVTQISDYFLERHPELKPIVQGQPLT